MLGKLLPACQVTDYLPLAPAWDMPGLPDELIASKSLDELIASKSLDELIARYSHANALGRESIDRVAEMAAEFKTKTS